MKKTVLITGIIALGVLLFISSCNKTNVKSGNKNIIGTWELVLESTIGTSNSTSTYTYSPANICWTNYVSTYSSSYSRETTQTSVTEAETYTETVDGETTTESSDTTWTITRNTEITFNEDGTCKFIDYTTDVDDDGNPDNSGMEMTGYWNWLDAYEEKTGINIVIMGMDYRKASEGFNQAMEMHFYIDVLDKEDFKLSFTSTNTSSGEYSYYQGTCYNETTLLDEEIYRTYVYSGTYAETGDMEFKKVE